MPSAHQQMKQILEALTLKRQMSEEELGRLIRLKQTLTSQLEALSAPCSRPPLEEGAQIYFAVAAQKWESWRDRQKHALYLQQKSLDEKIKAQKTSLQLFVVQIDRLQTELESVEKSLAREREIDRSNQRLETWLAAK